MSIQSAGAYNGGTSFTASVAFGSSTTAGNTIAAFNWTRDNVLSSTAITDTQGNAYGSPVQSINYIPGGNTYTLGAWVVTGIVGGADTVTATVTPNQLEQIISIVEEPASAGVRSSAQASSSGSAAVQVSLTGAVSGDVVLGATSNASSGAPGSPTVGGTAGAAQTNPFPDVSFVFDGSSPSTGTQVVSFAVTTSQWGAIAIALMPSGGGGKSDIIPMTGGGRRLVDHPYLRMHPREEERRALRTESGLWL